MLLFQSYDYLLNNCLLRFNKPWLLIKMIIPAIILINKFNNIQHKVVIPVLNIRNEAGKNQKKGFWFPSKISSISNNDDDGSLSFIYIWASIYDTKSIGNRSDSG